MNTKTLNIQALALLGDAVFSLYVREELLKLGINNPKLIQSESVKYVSAKSQSRILSEIDIVRRGRNNKKDNHPKNTDVITYKLSTGFEALLGDLYINNKERLKEILSYIEVIK